MSKIGIQVYILVPFQVQDSRNQSVKVWREIPRNVIIDARTSTQDILNALMQKRIPSQEFKYFSLYLTVKKNFERKFIRCLEPTELPLILMLHENSKNYEFYIKKKDKSEHVSIYLDLRKELLKVFTKDQLQTRVIIAQDYLKNGKSKIISRYKKELEMVKDKMTELGFDLLPGM
jgi:hypothetical protein